MFVCVCGGERSGGLTTSERMTISNVNYSLCSQAGISGGVSRYVGWNITTLWNAHEDSYDPDEPTESRRENLTVQWFCKLLSISGKRHSLRMNLNVV